MYRTTITLNVLSEEEIPFGWELSDIVREADDGKYVMSESREPAIILTDAEMAAALIEAGSDPEFFNLTETGERIED